MVKNLPEFFADPSETIFPNYSFIDFASGRGYVKFLGSVPNGMQQSGAGLLSGAVLTNSTFASEPVYQRKFGSDTAENKTFNQEFDAEFLLPLVVDGKAYISQPMLNRNPSTVATLKAFMNAAVKKEASDGTVTTLDSQSGSMFVKTIDSTANIEHTFTIALDLPTTNFGVGDKLRVATELHQWTDVAKNIITHFAHDPLNRTIDT